MGLAVGSGLDHLSPAWSTWRWKLPPSLAAQFLLKRPW